MAELELNLNPGGMLFTKILESNQFDTQELKSIIYISNIYALDSWIPHNGMWKIQRL